MALMTDLDDRIKLTVENRGSNEWSVECDFQRTRNLASVESLIYCICIYSDMQFVFESECNSGGGLS